MGSSIMWMNSQMVVQILHHTEDAPEQTDETINLGHFLRAVFDCYEFGSVSDNIVEHFKFLLSAQIYGEDNILNAISDSLHSNIVPGLADCIWDFLKCEPEWDINEKAFNWFFESRMMGKEPDWQSLAHTVVGRGINSVDEELWALLFQCPGLDPLSETVREEHNFFHLAAHGNDVETAKFLLKQYPKIDFLSAGKVPPLHVAVQRDALDFVKFLLGLEGLNANAPCVTNDGGLTTPLVTAYHLRKPASNQGDDDKNEEANQMADLLLASDKVDVNFVANNESNLLHAAVERNDRRFVERLLERDDIDANVVCAGLTPLMRCITQGHFDMFEFLVHHEKVDIDFRVDGQNARALTSSIANDEGNAERWIECIQAYDDRKERSQCD